MFQQYFKLILDFTGLNERNTLIYEMSMIITGKFLYYFNFIVSFSTTCLIKIRFSWPE